MTSTPSGAPDGADDTDGTDAIRATRGIARAARRRAHRRRAGTLAGPGHAAWVVQRGRPAQHRLRDGSPTGVGLPQQHARRPFRCRPALDLLAAQPGAPLEWWVTVVVRLVFQALATVLLWRLLRALVGYRAVALHRARAVCLERLPRAPDWRRSTAGWVWPISQACLVGALLAHVRYPAVGGSPTPPWPRCWCSSCSPSRRARCRPWSSSRWSRSHSCRPARGEGDWPASCAVAGVAVLAGALAVLGGSLPDRRRLQQPVVGVHAPRCALDGGTGVGGMSSARRCWAARGATTSCRTSGARTPTSPSSWPWRGSWPSSHSSSSASDARVRWRWSPGPSRRGSPSPACCWSGRVGGRCSGR